MKNSKKINLLIAIFVFSVSFTAGAESFNNNNVLDTYNNTTEMVINTNTSIIEFIGFYNVPVFSLLVNKNYLSTNDLFLEETLEMEEWMLDYNWIDAEESIIEEDMQLEVWMQHPKNWGIYQCGADTVK